MTNPVSPEIVSEPPVEPEPQNPFKIPAYRNFWIARLCSVFGYSSQSAVIAWQIYETARKDSGIGEAALYIGIMGLTQFLAMFAFTLPAGIVADRYDRKKIMGYTIGVQALIALGYMSLSALDHPPVVGLIALSFFLGATRAFIAPASSAIGPMLVPKSVLPRAIASNALAFQIGGISGAAVSGILLSVSALFAYGVSAALFVIGGALIATLKVDTRPVNAPTGSKMEMVKEGLIYIWTNKIVFGALSLDLAAVLLGGATALLPIFARDVLHAGEIGYGALRAAPAAGAMLTAIWLARRPLKYQAGKWMYGGVAVFGLMTVIFGLSTNIAVSVAALAVLGAADMVSVFVRGTLVQIVTPDPMRGRVAAVSYLFIGASNELGEFESGVATRLLGPVGAALFGGVGAILVTGAWIKLFPALYRVDKLE
ncbi:MFS transporter [Asticcacaulis sp. BYS171W]|uniref:MFS transporter n=1 Tax=Asticcacaulis aquaticus TaxID=2984212 RepID=A0ABT5HXF7_9CAUL|nr:MFS transporter [Asticcacaulis aquaticus]MDC7684760.1 MFS transporter [Asticcacaulis aquaticus]